MPCFNWKTLPEKGRGALLKDGLKCGVASRGKFACAASANHRPPSSMQHAAVACYARCHARVPGRLMPHAAVVCYAPHASSRPARARHRSGVGFVAEAPSNGTLAAVFTCAGRMAESIAVRRSNKAPQHGQRGRLGGWWGPRLWGPPRA